MKLRNLLQKCDYFYKIAQNLNQELNLNRIYILKSPITVKKRNKDGTYKEYIHKVGTVIEPIEYKENGDLYANVLGRYTSEKFKSITSTDVIDLKSFLEGVARSLGVGLDTRGSGFVKEFSITYGNTESTIYFDLDNKSPKIKIEIVDTNNPDEAMEIDNQAEVLNLISSEGAFINALFPQAQPNLLDNTITDDILEQDIL